MNYTITVLFEFLPLLRKSQATLSEYSQNNDYALIDKQSNSRAPPEFMYSETGPSETGAACKPKTGNVFNTKTFKNSTLDNNSDLSD